MEWDPVLFCPDKNNDNDTHWTELNRRLYFHLTCDQSGQSDGGDDGDYHDIVYDHDSPDRDNSLGHIYTWVFV